MSTNVGLERTQRRTRRGGGAWHRGLLSVLALAPVLALAACAAPPRKPAVPVELADRAMILNNPAIRTWGFGLNPAFEQEILRAGKREFELRAQAGQTGPLPPAHYLAISGGGANGAYGAGMLCGWTAAGTRPEFKVVTGISTGALTAPFAFLGSAHDDALRRIYCTVRTEQIATARNIIAALLGDALMETGPLRKLVADMVNERMVRDIAREYDRGRLLLVVTTNLDMNRAVIWNIGAIAASGDPSAVTLIHDVLMASAAIPAAFPPVMFDVTVDGKEYQEMHVDGGARSQVFLYPPSFSLKSTAAAHGIVRDRVAYIIRNSKLAPTWSQVTRRTLPIAARAIDSMIQTQGYGDLFRIYLSAQQDGVDFNLAYIPETFKNNPAEDFDPNYMTALFKVGYEAANSAQGYPWDKSPPGIAVPKPAGEGGGGK